MTTRIYVSSHKQEIPNIFSLHCLIRLKLYRLLVVMISTCPELLSAITPITQPQKVCFCLVWVQGHRIPGGAA